MNLTQIHVQTYKLTCLILVNELTKQAYKLPRLIDL